MDDGNMARTIMLLAGLGFLAGGIYTGVSYGWGWYSLAPLGVMLIFGAFR